MPSTTKSSKRVDRNIRKLLKQILLWDRKLKIDERRKIMHFSQARCWEWRWPQSCSPLCCLSSKPPIMEDIS